MIAWLKKLDWQHGFIIVVFLAAMGDAVYSFFAQKTISMALLLASAPTFVLGVNNVLAFFKNPPSDPATAAQEGEAVLGGDTGAGPRRGFVRLSVLRWIGVIALIGVLGMIIFRPTHRRETIDLRPQHALVAPAMQLGGCGWFSSNGTTVTTDTTQIGICIFGAIAAGAADPAAVLAACAGATLQILVEVAQSLLDYYLLGADAGAIAASGQACGNGPPPIKGAPQCAPATLITALRKHHDLASAQLAAGH